MCDMTRYYKGCSNEKYTFTEYEELEYGLLDNKNGKVLGGEEILDLLNHLSKENEQLRQKLDFYLLDEFEWKEKYGDCDE